MAGERIYLDHLASTPLAPEAGQALTDALARPGNPGSAHGEGRAAKDALESARSRIASVLDVRPREVVFTASGTSASQIAMLGVARARREVSRRVVLSAVEHPAIREAAEALASEGFEVVPVAPNGQGTVQADAFLDAVGDTAAVAALMLANHETGILMPVRQIGNELRRRGIPFVCDACLGPGRVAVQPGDLAADVLALSAHKCNGPRGVGLLYVRRRTPLIAPLRGGSQEEGLHPGTENVAGAAAFAAALARCVVETEVRAKRYQSLLARFLAPLETVRPWSPVGDPVLALPGVVTLEIPGVEGEAAMINLDLEGVAASTGSACAMGAAEPSPTLLAMGLSRRRAARTLRISMGEGLTGRDAERAGELLASVITRLRALGPPRR